MKQTKQKYNDSHKSELLAAIAAGTPRASLVKLLDGLNSGNFIQAATLYPRQPKVLQEAISLEYPRLVLTLAGTYRAIFDAKDRQRDWVLERGQGYWIRPGDWVTVCNATRRSMLSISFPPTHTRFIWYEHSGDGTNLNPPEISLIFHTLAPPSEGLRRQVQAMNQAGEAGCGGLVLATARSLLAWCQHELQNDPEGMQSASRQLFYQVSYHVSGHLSGNLSREVVAKRFRLSVGHLTRLFHDYARMGFNEFVRRERLSLARRLLHTGRLSVKEIGSACGFNVTAYFIRRFREEYGMPPAAYRRRLSSPNGE